MNKLAIITTHPIQYHAPLFRMLHERKNISAKIFYTWSQSAEGKKFDPGFGQNIEWDIPLLDGYDYTFVNNISTSSGSHHYNGINNPTLIREILDWGATAVLVYGWNFKSHLAAIRFFYKKVPVFFRGDSTLLDEKQGLKQLLRRIVLRYIYSQIDVALYTGVANKAYFKVMGLQEHQLIFMPHSVDNSRFAANKDNMEAGDKLRETLHIPTDAILFLFAGKLEKKKQPAFLIDSFVSLNSKTAYLIIAGSGELESTLKNNYLNNSFIKFIGFKNQYEMPAVYNCCNIFILPSKGPNETWGLSINEAMAAGKPVIASNKCGASFDLINDNKNGFVFKYDDSASLKAVLSTFLNNKNDAEKMGKVSADIIKQYSFVHDCKAIENSVNAIRQKYIK